MMPRTLLSCDANCVPQAGDSFTSGLMDIFNTIEAEGGTKQPLCVAINRSDYMLHDPDDGITSPHLLQVSFLLFPSKPCGESSTDDCHHRSVPDDWDPQAIIFSCLV